MEREKLDQIKERADFFALIAERAKKSRLKNLFHCPLPGHDDKTPSFSVSPTKGLFHCHGCNRGGDVFTFIQEMDGLSFPQAVEYLANRLGIPYEKKCLTEQELRLLKQKARERQERVAELNRLEDSYKETENVFYDTLRRLRYQLPHYRRGVVFLDPKIYAKSLNQEHQIDEMFDWLDELVAERKRKFQEDRNAIYRD